MASKLVGIVGATGTGKSTSIKHLDPKETYIINVAKKELPFKGAENRFGCLVQIAIATPAQVESKTPEKSNFSYLFFTARMVPMGKHIFSFGIISFVLSFVCFIGNQHKHAEDTYFILLSKLG